MYDYTSLKQQRRKQKWTFFFFFVLKSKTLLISSFVSLHGGFSAFAAKGKMDFVFQLLACCVLSVHIEKKQKKSQYSSHLHVGFYHNFK